MQNLGGKTKSNMVFSEVAYGLQFPLYKKRKMQICPLKP